MQELVKVERIEALEARPELRQILADALAALKPSSRYTYQAALKDYARFRGHRSPTEAILELVSLGAGEANALAAGYLADLLERGLAPKTINLRLVALRWAVAKARLVGLVAWDLQVKGPKAITYRDTRGPGLEGYRAMLAALEGDSPKAIRDRAILRLMGDCGLRRGELVSLDLTHLDLEAGAVEILGKGRYERERVSLPTQTVEALAAWLEIRGPEPGPLFLNLDRAGKGGRLTGRSIGRIVAAVGRSAGLKVSPHGLRHAAITAALDLTGGDIRGVRRFSRHAAVETVMIYDDNRQDMGGEIARLVAAAVG